MDIIFKIKRLTLLNLKYIVRLSNTSKNIKKKLFTYYPKNKLKL